jgi:hypothetical protein
MILEGIFSAEVLRAHGTLFYRQEKSFHDNAWPADSAHSGKSRNIRICVIRRLRRRGPADGREPTSAPRLAFLERSIFVASAVREADGVYYTAYRVT